MILQKYKQNSISGAFCMFFNAIDCKKKARCPPCGAAPLCHVSLTPCGGGCYSSVSRGRGFMSYEAIARVNPQ